MSTRVAVVTGAASGIGAAAAVALASTGSAVACVDLDEAGNGATVGSIRAAGGAANGYLVDVAREAEVQRVFKAIDSDLGTADAVVHCAGVCGPPARVHEILARDWRRTIEVDLDSALWILKSALPGMMAKRYGAIVLISSICGLGGVGSPRAIVPSSYSAAKAGLIGLARQAAVEYAEMGIRVNVVAPGWHRGTQLGALRRVASSASELEADDGWIRSRVPMKRMGDVEELMGIICLLASRSSSYMTGQVLVSDGGWMAQ